MNQLDNAFGDNNNNNGVPNPVVIMGQNPSVWLGPNYDEEAQKNGEQKANGNENNMNPQTWETINRQIQQNMIGNVSVLKEMVSGLERGETRMELFGTATDHLHQKIHLLTDRVIALETFASTITPTIKDLMGTVNTLVYNIQGFAGSAERDSLKAQKKLERATTKVENNSNDANNNKKEVSFADEKGKELESVSPQPPPEIVEVKDEDEEETSHDNNDPKSRMTPNTANEYDQITRKNSAKIIQRNWKIYRHNKLIRSMVDMTKKRVKKEFSLANRLKSIEEAIDQMKKEKEEDNSINELLEKVWEEVERKALRKLKPA